jgi:hypothetical protein
MVKKIVQNLNVFMLSVCSMLKNKVLKAKLIESRTLSASIADTTLKATIQKKTLSATIQDKKNIKVMMAG